MPPIFVDARDLAERLEVSYDTVLTWVRRGKIPHVQDGRRRFMFNLNAVMEALRQKPLNGPPYCRRKGWCAMTPAPRRKSALADPGPSDWPFPAAECPMAAEAQRPGSPGRPTLPIGIEPMLSHRRPGRALELFPPARGTDAIRRQSPQARLQDRQDAPLEGRHDSSVGSRGVVSHDDPPARCLDHLRRLLCDHN